MIHYLLGAELDHFPELKESMFRDRKDQFVDRLGWDLKVNEQNHEVDEYDRPDALYIICSNDDGRHLGSMRLIPSSKAIMTNDHFRHIIPGIEFKSRDIWECTRFCSSSTAGPRVATSILSAASKFMFEQKLRAYLAVFDERIRRIYYRIGIPPLILGSTGYGSKKIGVGLWQFNASIYKHIVELSLYDAEEYEAMYSRSFESANAAITRQLVAA